MKLIVGLGNPGPKYLNTRHNFGFMALNYFQDAHDVFSSWETKEKFQSLVSEGQLGDEKIILAKPQTMMNLSGEAIQTLASFYQIPPEDIWVVHDDLDLPLGMLRLSQNASSGGHQGINSTIAKLGTKNFIRVRLGIRPVGETWPKDHCQGWLCFFKKLAATKKFVLAKFTDNEKAAAQQVVKKASEALTLALKEGLEKAQSTFN
ncbi:MAG TPA: aminoacyl-tRNA hydrolase [Candidatus Portnoybacteria bacterium]|nr:aminoacyl-tRNA hydrolase [Candidatus Portnoybacteria bacterium]